MAINANSAPFFMILHLILDLAVSTVASVNRQIETDTGIDCLNNQACLLVKLCATREGGKCRQAPGCYALRVKIPFGRREDAVMLYPFPVYNGAVYQASTGRFNGGHALFGNFSRNSGIADYVAVEGCDQLADLGKPGDES